MSSDIRICFVGDSFVNGTGDEASLGWAGRLCASANHSGGQLTYYNLGVRRNTSQDVLERWQQECALRLPDTVDGRIVFSFGVNDTVIENGAIRVEPHQSVINFKKIIQAANTYSLLVVGPPPVSDEIQNERILHLSDTYAEQASVLGIPYIELLRPLREDDLYMKEIASNDGSHPQGAGYAKMASIISGSPSWWFGKKTR